jgi:hypothetical protein
VDPLPPDAKYEVVMSAAAFDGHSVTTHRFRSGRAPEQLADALRERWRSEGVRFVESTRGEWLVLSTRRESAVETLQLRRTAAGTEGLHSVWQRDPSAGVQPSPGAAERLRSLLPDGARALREIAHRDGPREGATVVAISAQPLPAVLDALQSRLAQQGFAPDRALLARRPAAVAGAPGTPPGRALAFRRGGDEVIATVADHRGERAIVLHWSARR